jgi:hypothetical protein
MSVRNIMSVADIEGASPSVAPDKVKNIKKGKEYLHMGGHADSLGQYEKLFNLKQINASGENSSLCNNGLSSNSEIKSLAKRYSPTYITTFAMHS